MLSSKIETEKMSYLWSLLETLLQKGNMTCKDWANYYQANVRKYQSLTLYFRIGIEQHDYFVQQGDFAPIDWKRKMLLECEAKGKKYERLASWCENLSYKLKAFARKIGIRELAYESSLSALLSNLEQLYCLYKRGHANSKKRGHQIFGSDYKSRFNRWREDARRFKATAREIRRRRQLLGVLQLFYRSALFLPSERLDETAYFTVFQRFFDHTVSSTFQYLDLLKPDFAYLCQELCVEI
jgi:hypothetical protein